MSVPLRKDEQQEELTTADLAQTKRPVASEELRPQPVASDRMQLQRSDLEAPVEPIEMERAEMRSTNNTREETTPLFPSNELEELRERWNGVQAAFVDEPRKAVENADSLVASAMKRLAEVFAEERARLEKQWDRGDDVSTEDLRIALQRYRSFFQRLLSI
jgi:hypothetical protein